MCRRTRLQQGRQPKLRDVWSKSRMVTFKYIDSSHLKDENVNPKAVSLVVPELPVETLDEKSTVKLCSRCLYDSTIPGITFDKMVMCNYCEMYDQMDREHCPLGPIALAAGVQLAASIPNFLCQEQVSLGQGYLKKSFTLRDGYLDLPTGPGLGIELDDNAMAIRSGMIGGTPRATIRTMAPSWIGKSELKGRASPRPGGVHRQNSVGSKSVASSGRYLHTPTHDRDPTLACHFHNCSS